MMNVLASEGGCYTLALCMAFYSPLIPELSLLLGQIPLYVIMVTMIKLTVLNTAKLGSVCLWKNLSVLDWLNSAVVVVLVYLLVNCRVDLLVLVRLHNLLSDGRGNRLVDCCVMVA